MTRWLTIFLTVLAATVFGLTPEAGALGFGAAKNQPASAAQNPAIFTTCQPSDFTPISGPANLQKPLENKAVSKPCYLNPETGRFWTRDSYEGDLYDPVSLHKYLYASSSPVEYIDPSGFMTLGEVMHALKIQFNIRKNEIQAGKKAYDFTKKAVCGASYVSFTTGAVAYGGHHIWPKFLKGPEKQILAEIGPDLHRILHRLIQVLVKDDELLKSLDALGGPKGSTGQWGSLLKNPKAAAAAEKVLRQATLAVDKFCGFKKPLRMTDILNDMLSASGGIK